MTKPKADRMYREEQYQVARSMRMPLAGVGKVWNRFLYFDCSWSEYKEEESEVISRTAHVLGGEHKVILRDFKARSNVKHFGPGSMLELLWRLGVILNEIHAAKEQSHSSPKE